MSRRSLAEHVTAGKRLVVFVGPGGVGKTTVSAAVAVAAAAEGRRVALLTIDPARRLADALGLDGLDDRLVPLSESRMRRLGSGSLHAAMLDTKASFDALVRRLAPTDRAEAILDNRVYRAFSRTLARSHAYIAAERLNGLLSDERFDLIIVDTPPTRSALDFFDAPIDLARFLHGGAVNALLGARWPEATPNERATERSLAQRLLGKLVGDTLVDELVTFFLQFLPMREGFAERASATMAALKSERTRFALVAAPDEAHLHDAARLREGLTDRGLGVSRTIFNRAFVVDADGTPATARPPLSDGALRQAWPGATPDELDRVREDLDAARSAAAEHNRSARELATRFLRDDEIAAMLPLLDDEPTDLVALRAMAGAARPLRRLASAKRAG